MKTAIIGGGINGLYLAWKLSEKGEEVVVFERKNKIGKQACSGLFSERILKFIPQSEKLIENEINYCLIYLGKQKRKLKTSEKTLKIKFSRKFLIINHYQLDNLVADLARKSGAKIILNKKKIEKEKLLASFDRIIGCDGANSLVREWLKLPPQKFFLGIQGFINEKNDLNYVETWPTKKGFIWKIPRGKNTEWGIMEEPKKAKQILDQFLANNNLLQDIKSSLIPRGPLVFNNKEPFITLCGDAAGLVKPWSGGGVVWGLKAADFLLENFPDFLKYQKETEKFFGPKIIFSKFVKKIVYFIGFNFPWIMPQNLKIESDFLV